MVHQLTVRFPRRLKKAFLVDPKASLAVMAPPPPPSGPPPDFKKELADSLAKDRENIGQILSNLSEVGQSLLNQQDQRLREMQLVAIELAAALTSRILRTHFDTETFPIENLVQSVVERLDSPQAGTIYLHPQDLDLLKRRSAESPEKGVQGNFKFQADSNLSRGDCRAETSDGNLLSRLDDQLEILRNGLVEKVSAAETERRNSERGLKRFPDRRQTG